MDLRLDLLLETRDADHEELVEVGPVDGDELQTLEERIRLVDRLLEDAIVEIEPRGFAVDVERGIVEGDGPRAFAERSSSPICEPVVIVGGFGR